jgi:8-oxo-dGTP diphosphatase
LNDQNESVDKSVQEIYGNRLRVRVCGLCRQNGQILMVNHAGLRDGPFWAPPGGGMDLGQSAIETLEREFLEETGLTVTVGPMRFVTEFIHPPLHAIELFYEVTVVGGKMVTGSDPELASTIREVRFLSTDEIDSLPVLAKHGAFGLVPTSGRIGELNGYFRI